MKGRSIVVVGVYLDVFLYFNKKIPSVAMLGWVTHWDSEWRTGFINLCQPSAHEFGGHFSLHSGTYTHAAKSDGDNVSIHHPGGHKKTALHHEVHLLAALLPAVGVPWIFSSHHRGEWKQTHPGMMGICMLSTYAYKCCINFQKGRCCFRLLIL